jgi:hypothetical protein
MIRLIFAIAASAIALGAPAARAVPIFQESFENPPGSTYTLNTAFDDGEFDYFNRYPVPDNSNAARDDFQNGWDGSFGIQGQDHDGDGGQATVSIDTSFVSSAAPTHVFTVSLGALNSEPMFQNFEAVDGDGIELYFIDGSLAPVLPLLIGAFKPPASGAGDLYQDTDLDGVGDGALLTTTLQDYSFSVPSTFPFFALRIQLTSTSSFESLAVDNIRIDAIPEPGALTLLAIGGWLIVVLRRTGNVKHFSGTFAKPGSNASAKRN